jgi:transposase
MKKEKQSYRKYDAAFKQEVLRQLESGQPVSSLAKSLGISENLIYVWRSQVKQQHALATEEKSASQECEQLRQKLRQVELEPDILKAA